MKKNEPPETIAPPQISTTKDLPKWLNENKIALGFTARRANKLFLAGGSEEGKLSIFERTFDNASGLAVSGDSLFLANLYQVWHLRNGLLPDQTQNGYDRAYIPQVAYTTGDCAVHEMGLNSNGQLIFVNTRFSCLAGLSTTHSFKPLWKPDFITGLVPEDRCHLNGMALSEQGQVKYVTACSATDVKDGWRKERDSGGCLIDVEQNKIVLQGLSMPHSPRIHNGKIWLLNSGYGQLGWFNQEKQNFEPLIDCPGFLRGLVFVDNYAIVTISKPRASDVFSGLPLEVSIRKTSMGQKNGSPECGVLIIDIAKQEIVHRITIEGVVEELMDVVVIKNCHRPMLIGLKTDEIKNIFSFEPAQDQNNTNSYSNPILV